MEWISFEDEIVLLAEEMVLARLNPGALGWPAQRFWISGKAYGLCNSIPGFHKGGRWVSYIISSSLLLVTNQSIDRSTHRLL